MWEKFLLLKSNKQRIIEEGGSFLKIEGFKAVMRLKDMLHQQGDRFQRGSAAPSPKFKRQQSIHEKTPSKA